MRCDDTSLDCDGLVETGCEARRISNDNCGACGSKCDDTKPCISINGDTPACGCPEPLSYCAGLGDECQDLRRSDENCGACHHACDTPAALPANSYYGCAFGECGHLKCKEGYLDCNGDLAQPDSDGCEAHLGSHENCRRCGDNCLAAGMHCVASQDNANLGLACNCQPGENFCGSSDIEPFFGVCADFASNAKNCGACGHACPGDTQRSKGVCQYGRCKLECKGRWGDCNGNVDDDCEVDTFSDPKNCGGCGITCDVAAGQACAGGRCVVEPCPDEGSR